MLYNAAHLVCNGGSIKSCIKSSIKTSIICLPTLQKMDTMDPTCPTIKLI